MDPVFFSNQHEFRNWLEKHHKTAKELIVGYYKIKSGKASMTWSESVDQAICFGWIDGIRRSIDDQSYQIRFTPRLKTSIWSAINIKKVESLTAKGLMHEAGLEIYTARKESKSKVYAFENEEMRFSPELERIFKANKSAWEYFQALSSTYRKPSVMWVMSAKLASTRLKRLTELISDCAAGTNKWKHSKYIKK